MSDQPQNSELVASIAENAIIGLALEGEPADFMKILATTQVDDFITPSNRALREALSDFELRGELDLGLLASNLEARGLLGTTITVDDLHTLRSLACLPLAADEHISRLKTARAARTVRDSLGSATTTLSTSPLSTSGLSSLIDTTVETLQTSMIGVGGQEWVEVGQAAFDLINKDHSGPSSRIPTGLDDLDNVLTGGIGQGQMCIIAARPGFGKSTLALDIARHASQTLNLPSLLISMEMNVEEVTARFLAGTTRIGHSEIRQGELTNFQKDTLNKALTEMVEETPFYIDARSSVTTADLSSTFARLNAQCQAQRGKGLKLVVIDYVQLMDAGEMARGTSREQQVASFSRAAKKLALDHDVAVIAVAQLNRGRKTRDGAESVRHKPSLSDLRESGALEQDADIVLLLSLDEENESEHPRGPMEISVAKNRTGPCGDVPVTLVANLPSFEARTVGEQKTEMWD